MANYVDLVMKIASMKRSQLIDLKERLATAVLNNDPKLNLSFDEVLRANELIDRELDHRADTGDLR